METQSYELILGKCEEEMKVIPDESHDSCVTDPPYDLVSIVKRYGGKEAKETRNPVHNRMTKGFMNQTWDGTGIAFSVDMWKEVYRILKPGAYLLAFGGTRTEHRMKVAIEDAGFVILDTMLAWIYSTGFPKAVNISKAIDLKFFRLWVKTHRPRVGKNKKVLTRLFNATNKDFWATRWFEMVTDGYGIVEGKREVYTEVKQQGAKFKVTQETIDNGGFNDPNRDSYNLTKPSTEQAKLWEGWATALCPSLEPICVAQKPFDGSIADNILKHGVGAMNVDDCRIGSEEQTYGYSKTQDGGVPLKNVSGSIDGRDPEKIARRLKKNEGIQKTVIGRWPKNLILQHHPECKDNECYSDCPCLRLDQQSGIKTSAISSKEVAGEASRFFINLPYECPLVYVPKPSRSERELDLENMETQKVNDGRKSAIDNPFQRGETERKGIHPTKKPTKLLRYLVRLVTPKSGKVLDPFVGSGTTLIAALREGMKGTGIEAHPPYHRIAETALKAESKRSKLRVSRTVLFDDDDSNETPHAAQTTRTASKPTDLKKSATPGASRMLKLFDDDE